MPMSWKSPHKWIILFWIAVGSVAAICNALMGFPVKGPSMITAVLLWTFVLLAIGDPREKPAP